MINLLYTILSLYYSKKYGQKYNKFDPLQISNIACLLISVLVLILIIQML